MAAMKKRLDQINLDSAAHPILKCVFYRINHVAVQYVSYTTGGHSQLTFSINLGFSKFLFLEQFLNSSDMSIWVTVNVKWLELK